jgi:hypothetical protein
MSESISMREVPDARRPGLHPTRDVSQILEPGFAFGWAARVPTHVCASCAVGSRLDLPIASLMGIAALDVAIPPNPGLVGIQFALQGFSLGPWSCYGAMRFTDTVAFTIR